jgi:hypothetical protein
MRVYPLGLLRIVEHFEKDLAPKAEDCFSGSEFRTGLGMKSPYLGQSALPSSLMSFLHP